MLDLLGRPAVLDPPFHFSKLVIKPGALAVGALKSGLKPAFLNFEVVGGCMDPPVNLDDEVDWLSAC